MKEDIELVKEKRKKKYCQKLRQFEVYVNPQRASTEKKFRYLCAFKRLKMRVNLVFAVK